MKWTKILIFGVAIVCIMGSVSYYLKTHDNSVNAENNNVSNTKKIDKKEINSFVSGLTLEIQYGVQNNKFVSGGIQVSYDLKKQIEIVIPTKIKIDDSKSSVRKDVGTVTGQVVQIFKSDKVTDLINQTSAPLPDNVYVKITGEKEKLLADILIPLTK